MKQKNYLLKLWMLLLCVVAGVGNVWGDSYTITFKTGSGDGTAASTSTACSIIVSEGSSYLSGNLATTTNVYYNGANGLKLGKSGGSGVIKMNLTSSITPTSIVVKAKRYNSSKAATLKVNGSATQNIISDFSDLTFNITSEISYLQLESSNYCWISSITVNYASASSSPLSSIALSGEYPTSFHVGDAFSHEGMTVTATYEDNSNQDVTANATFNGYDMSTWGRGCAATATSAPCRRV